MQLRRKQTHDVPSLLETLPGAAAMSSRWLRLPTSDQLWNMLHQCGTHTLSARPTKLNGFNVDMPAMPLASLITPAV